MASVAGPPWVRPRANARYVTLHDALAEELAQRLIPLHDQDGAWRTGLWHRAEHIYAALTAEKDERVVAGLTRVGNALQSSGDGGERRSSPRSRQVDAQKRELDQLLTAQLHYAILDDFSSGTDRFLELFRPSGGPAGSAVHGADLPRDGDVPARARALASRRTRCWISRWQQYRRWLAGRRPERYGAIAVQIAGFLIRNEQPTPAWNC